jgi:hypothetical protein
MLNKDTSLKFLFSFSEITIRSNIWFRWLLTSDEKIMHRKSTLSEHSNPIDKQSVRI